MNPPEEDAEPTTPSDLKTIMDRSYTQCTFIHEDGHNPTSPIYLDDPKEATASLNAGDQRLYVGGASINLEFSKSYRETLTRDSFQSGVKFTKH